MIAIHNKYNKTNKRKHTTTSNTTKDKTDKTSEAIEMCIPREKSPNGADLVAIERNILVLVVKQH